MLRLVIRCLFTTHWCEHDWNLAALRTLWSNPVSLCILLICHNLRHTAHWKKVAVSSNYLKGPCTLQRLEPKCNQLKFCFERIFMVYKCLQDQEKKAWQSQKPAYAVLIPQNNLPHAVSAPAGYRDFTWSCCQHVTLTTKKHCQKKLC